MKSLNVGNEEIFHEVKVIGEYTTTVAMKEDTYIERDGSCICLIRSMYG